MKSSILKYIKDTGKSVNLILWDYTWKYMTRYNHLHISVKGHQMKSLYVTDYPSII